MLDQNIVELINKMLDLDSFSTDIQKRFWDRMLHYLDHGKTNDVINGRTLEYIEKNLTKLIHFFESVGYTKEEYVHILSTMPSLINLADVIYNKYLMLGCIVKPGEVDIRKEKLLARPLDLMLGLDEIISRYLIISQTGYGVFTWNNMTHISKTSFANIFVTKIKPADYKIFENVDSAKQYMENMDVSDFPLDEVKKWDVNRELVEKYENKSFGI